MKKTVYGIAVCMLMILSTVVPISSTVDSTTTTPLSRGITLYVGGSGPGNYTMIQEAIDAAGTGDTVYVFNGVYHESIIVPKSITLIGENRDATIIDGVASDYVVRLYSNQITFTSFTVQHGKEDGIYIYGDNVTVSGNKLVNNSRDIFLSRSNNTITDNILFGGGLDIYYYYGHHNIVTDNYVKGKPLVYLEEEHDMTVDADAGQLILLDCENITIQNQTVHDISYGVVIGGSKNCVVSQNTISNCFIGMYFIRSSKNDVRSNTFVNNTAFGIHFSNSSDNSISQNSISGSTWGSGIYIEYYSTLNTVLNNTLQSNGDGVHISSGHTIVKNNRITNNNQGIGLYNSSPTYKNDSASFSIIQGNTISHCGDGDGIFAWHVNNCNITENTIFDNRYGIRLWNCTDNSITRNTLANNSWSGIELEDSNENLISGNAIDTSIKGIELRDSVNNRIVGNYLQMNQIGMYLASSSGNSIEYNGFIKNRNGIHLSESNDNTIYYNNFKRNEHHAFFLDSNNSWNANYWNRIRFLPYFIIGKKTVILPNQKEIQLPAVNYDRNPASKPYEIPSGQ